MNTNLEKESKNQFDFFKLVNNSVFEKLCYKVSDIKLVGYRNEENSNTYE